MPQQTYSTGEVIYGKGTQVRYGVIALGAALVRPAVASLKVIKAVTTSEIKGGQDTKDAPVDYDSVDGDWKDSRPGRKNWGFTMQANAKVDTVQAADFEALRDAWGSGQYVWIERLVPNDGFWRGGVAYVIDPTDPAPADGVVTFGCGFTGKAALTKTAVV